MTILYDICCGVGGASVGYKKAGFDHIKGIDNRPQPNYPFTFDQADIFDLDPKDFSDATLIHASFPCQEYSVLSGGQGNYPDLIAPGREWLNETGRPWVMENVPAAPLKKDLMLCGEMFKLRVIRHRIFETSGWSIPQLMHQPHNPLGAVRQSTRDGHNPNGYYLAVYGSGGGYKGTAGDWRKAMGIDWTWSKAEISQAIPPAYSWYVGSRFLKIGM